MIARGLAKDPAARYRSAGELAAACAEAVGLEPLPAPTGEAPRPPSAGSGSTPAAGARTIISD